MRWTRVTIHPRLNNISLMPKLLRGEGIVQEPRERVMPAALRESMTAGDTQLAGGDLAGRVPGPSSPFSASIYSQHFPLARLNQKAHGKRLVWSV